MIGGWTALLLTLLSQGIHAFNNPSGVDIWCGKAYRPTNASFNPGGWLNKPSSPHPLLDLRIRPRMNLYTPDEKTGSFIIDAEIGHTIGEAITQPSPTPTPSQFVLQESCRVLAGEIGIDGGGEVKYSIPLNSTGNEVSFELGSLRPRFEAYSVTLRASLGGKTFTAKTEVYRLPKKTDGSVTKIDSLYGGLLVREESKWSPLLPYSYYVSWGGWLEKDLGRVREFKKQGYNILHLIPGAGPPSEAFNLTELNLFIDQCDEVGLWVMWDMRWTYKNLTAVEEQVNMLKDRKSLLLWYTGDEPDGNSDPLNATKEAYDKIKSLDPWHPVSLCLNCFNFYFEEYTSGADIILSDVYPIAVNTSWSETYGTECNTTYGCCGCDDCQGNFDDISTRLDVFAEYQSWIGGSPKPFWGTPQAFGNESFWKRAPTPKEEVIMNLLSINHNAKGIVMWTYPTNQDIMTVTSALSRVLVTPEVTGFLLGARTTPLETGHDRIDAAGWRIGNRMLVSILYLEYSALEESVSVSLPGAKSVQTLWGNGWTVSKGQLVNNGLAGLEADVLIVEVD